MKVRSAEADTYEVGETVRLQIDVRNGLQAAFLAYIVPLILIVAELVCVSMFWGNTVAQCIQETVIKNKDQ